MPEKGVRDGGGETFGFLSDAEGWEWRQTPDASLRSASGVMGIRHPADAIWRVEISGMADW